MDKNQSEGHYILQFINAKGKVERRDEGDYTNGGATNSFVEFEIRPDTTLFRASSY